VQDSSILDQTKGR
jgi:hypothetical protein